MNTERDKFLTEAMGICFWLGHDCSKCADNTVARRVGAINFSTWEGFGKLFEWCKIQAWFVDFLYKNRIDIRYVNPDKLADTVYDYLKHTANALSMEEIGEVLYK